MQFALKTLLGAELSLCIALYFGLSQPMWAMMTAIIVAQPLAGMVVQKGLARLVGTLVGTAMSILLMSLSAQTPWLFLLMLSIWLGLCTAASTMLRSAWAYAFVLAGYTVAIISLPAIILQLPVLDHALARSTEIILGVICATATSALLWPQRVEQQLVSEAREVWLVGLAAAGSLLRGGSYTRFGLLQVLGRLVAVDAQREHAWFEGRQGRQRATAMRALSRDLLTVLRLGRGVARHWGLLGEAEAHALAPWMDELQGLLASPDLQQFRELEARLQSAALQADLPVVQQQCLARMAVLLRHVLIGAEALQAVEAGAPPPVDSPALSWHSDLQTASFCGLRSALTCGVLTVVWLATDWPPVIGALMAACVICSLFANRENARQLGLGFLYGTLVAVPLAFLVGQFMLPQLSEIAWVALALGVPVFFGALGMARPAFAISSIAFVLHFILLSAPQGHMRFDIPLFINETLALVLGIACAIVAFQLVQLRDPDWHGRRLLKAMLEDLGRLAGRDLSGAENWFGGRMADRLLQLAKHYPGEKSLQRNRWDDALSCLDLADELLHLRRCLAVGDGALDKHLAHFLRSYRQLVEAGPQAINGNGLDQPVEALAAALGQASSSFERRLALAALLQLQTSWKAWCTGSALPAGHQPELVRAL